MIERLTDVPAADTLMPLLVPPPVIEAPLNVPVAVTVPVLAAEN
jgi:hypothetical protein